MSDERKKPDRAFWMSLAAWIVAATFIGACIFLARTGRDFALYTLVACGAELFVLAAHSVSGRR